MLCLRESNCRFSKFAEVSKIAFRLPIALFNLFDRLESAFWNFKESRSSASLANFIICSPKGYLKFFGILNSSPGRWILVLGLAPFSRMDALFRDKAPNLSARSIFEKRCKTTDLFLNFNIYLYYLLKKHFLARVSKKVLRKTLFDSEFDWLSFKKNMKYILCTPLKKEENKLNQKL